MDSSTLSWIFDGRFIFQASHCPTHGARHWYALVDMVDPVAGQMATAMMSRENLRDTTRRLTAL